MGANSSNTFTSNILGGFEPKPLKKIEQKERDSLSCLCHCGQFYIYFIYSLFIIIIYIYHLFYILYFYFTRIKLSVPLWSILYWGRSSQSDAGTSRSPAQSFSKFQNLKRKLVWKTFFKILKLKKKLAKKPRFKILKWKKKLGRKSFTKSPAQSFSKF